MASEASPLLPRGTTTRGNRNRQRRGGSGRGGEEGRRRAMDRRQMPASGAAAESSAAGGRGGLGGGAVGASRSFTLAASQSRSQPDPPQHPYPQHSPPSSGPLLGQPVDEGILAVRAAALTVYSPLTYTWLIMTIGFSATIGLGMARWIGALPDLPLWKVLLPAWLSHLGLLCCHVLSARALAAFIADANENRSRPDSTDPLDRTEYLPLLQRALKFGLKTALLSGCAFVFELLVYLRLVQGDDGGGISLGAALVPIWILVGYGVLDGIVCKSQHFVRVLCWLLLLASMVLAVLKADRGYGEAFSWRVVVSPIVAMLTVSSATLIYIVYGHQVGYFRLTEAQLTASILYSMATTVGLLLIAAVAAGEAARLGGGLIVLGPLVMALVGFGAWGVTRDEFRWLLLRGGQAPIQPMRLTLTRRGWTAVETAGVNVLPMLGEVRCEPLPEGEGGGCCPCYPVEEPDEEALRVPGSQTEGVVSALLAAVPVRRARPPGGGVAGRLRLG